MSNPKVSIILTTHGKAPFLKQAIGSVLAQTFEDWECILAVDAKEENGWPKDFDKILDWDRRITCDASIPIPSTSCRFAATINRCFKFCKGDFITYLCHDDLYLPWRLEMMIKFFEMSLSQQVVFGWQQLLDETESGRYKFHDGPHGFSVTDPWKDQQARTGIRIGRTDQPAGTVDHSSVMHRRECFEKAGGWDEAAPMRYGDAYFWMRLQNAGYKFHCIPEVLDVHRFNQESITWKIDHPTEVTA